MLGEVDAELFLPLVPSVAPVHLHRFLQCFVTHEIEIFIDCRRGVYPTLGTKCRHQLVRIYTGHN